MLYTNFNLASQKVQMVSIEITRGEGPTQGTPIPVGKTFTFTSWEDANRHLRLIAADKRANPNDFGGYDKTDFVVNFADGETYSGRADVMADGDDTDLVKHISEFCGFLAGTYRPAHLTTKQYLDVMSRYEKDGTAQGAREYLAKYAIG